MTRGWASTRVLAGMLATAAACGGGSAPVVVAPPAAVVPAPSVAKPPRPPPPEDEPDAELPVEGVTSHPVFTGRFERIPLPPGTPAVVAIEGRDDRDVWMLAQGGTVLHWDGSRVTAKGRPACFTDSCCGRLFDCTGAPDKCTDAAIKSCSMGRSDCAWAVVFDDLRVTREEVVVRAWVNTGGLRSSLVESRLREGRFTCEQAQGDLLYPGSRARGDGPHVLELAVGGSSIRFEPPAGYGGGPYGLVIDGRRVPLPPGVTELAARSVDEIWVAGFHFGQDPGGLWRGDGLGWRPIPLPDDTGPERVWIGENGLVWVLGPAGTERGRSWGDELDRRERTMGLLRLDQQRSAWTRFATPGLLSVHGGEHDFWLLGKESFYVWDGRALSRAAAPLVLGRFLHEDGQPVDAWRSPSGALWVAGGALEKKPETKQAKGKSPVQAGVVLRVAGPERRGP
jgi:hypothetical protein